MKNVDVIKAFANKKPARTGLRNVYDGYGGYKGRTLESTGSELINYQTPIARWENGRVWLNDKKYSVTTSKIQGQLGFQLHQAGIETYTDKDEEIRKATAKAYRMAKDARR